MAGKVLWVFVLGALGFGQSAGAAAASRASSDTRGLPNVLILLCDDLGYGDVGCYGHPTIRTPNIDRLAAEGMRFTDGYAAAPVCSPSRAGLLTGRNANRFGIYDWIPGGSPMHMPSGEITIAELLRERGYATCQAGKWHCNGKFNSPAQPQPGDQGFDHWFATQNNAGPSHANPKNFVRNGVPVGALEGYSCQIVADEAIRWLRTGRPADRPFFQYVCFHESHEIVASPPELVARYASENNVDRATYYANVTNIDLAVGRILAALGEMGLDKNTLVVFTSDNGPETLNRYPTGNHCYGSPGPLRGMKLHLYEGGIRVPAIVRWPQRVRAGATSDQPVCSLDLLPTLCEIAGAALPAGRSYDGTSILPVLEGKPLAQRPPLFWFYAMALTEPKLAIRDGDFKLAAHWDVPPRSLAGPAEPATARAIQRARLTDMELYDLRHDVGETKDLAAAEPARVRQMSAALKAWFETMQDECPVWPGTRATSRSAR